MPCTAILHVHGRRNADGGWDWEPGNIIVTRRPGWKWGKKEKKLFQPVIIPHMTEQQAMPYQGRRRCKVDLDDIHDSDGARAAMRNEKLTSPVPKNLKSIHFTKGDDWGKPWPQEA